ncbi:MAG: HGGxSTG domain-containing protein [Lysobacteraceae bacterium]
MTDGYLSKDREHIAGRQRQRRARMARIDYYPSPDALALIESRRTRYGRTNNNSGILDTIIAEWAVFAGLKQSELDKPTSPATSPGVAEHYARMRISSESLTGTRAGASPAAPELSDTSRACAGARATSATPECLPASQARAGASDFDPGDAKPTPLPATAAPEFIDASTRANDSGLCHAKRAGAHANNSGILPAGVNQARVICGAKRRRDGQPCQALSVPGKRRCKWHGGASTGPKTDEGRVRSLANLQQHRNRKIETVSP